MAEGATADPRRRFEGKVAVVTGGGSGIGLAAVRRFVAEGATVVVGDIADEKLEAVAAELGDAVSTVRCDVTVERDIEALGAAAVERHGRLDVAFANAGFGTAAPIVSSDLAQWQAVIDVCLTGPMLTIKHTAPRMTAGGSIVVTASLNAVQPAFAMGAYCSAKAGVAMLTQVAAMELGPQGIRVNAVGPGLVRTPMTDAMWMTPEIVEEFEENAPLGRHATPEEIADLVAFLASHEAAYVSGSLYLVDGGAHTKRYPDFSGMFAG